VLSATMAQTEELIGLLKRAQASADEASARYLGQEIESRKRQVQALGELLKTSNPQSLG